MLVNPDPNVPQNLEDRAIESDVALARNPVLLVHGVMDTRHKMRKIARHLRGLGWQVYDIDLTPNNGHEYLEVLAAQIATLIHQKLPPDRSIDIIGFSMGGLVSRYYLQRLGGIDRVQRFISISAPHHGTIAALFSRLRGCVQMRPGHAFIEDLNSDVHILQRLNVTCLWTPFDLIILPPSSSQLDIGTNKTIPVLAHPLMVFDRRVLFEIVSALSQPVRSPIRVNSVAPNIASA